MKTVNNARLGKIMSAAARPSLRFAARPGPYGSVRRQSDMQPLSASRR